MTVAARGPIQGVQPAAKIRPKKKGANTPKGLFLKCILFSKFRKGIFIILHR